MQCLATIVQGPHHSTFGACSMPPFRFQPLNRSMDWRRMSVLDVDRVTRELDVATLQENLTDITFCTLDREVCSHCSQPLDQGLLNVLRLAQLSIEYLLHGQDFLRTRVTLLELHLQATLSQLAQSQQVLSCQAEELRYLQEERHQQCQMIENLQQLLQWSGGQSYYMCHLCEKMFLSSSCLWSHLQGSHEGTAQGEKQKQEESMEEVIRDLRAQLTSTQEELTALLKKQRQLQEGKTTCQRETEVKAMFQEWKEELSEEIDEEKQAFCDELKCSVLPNSPLEEKPAGLQSRRMMCSSLGSLQDAECQELLRQTQEYEDLRFLRDTKIQPQDEKQELQMEIKMLQRENKKLQEEKKKMQNENEKLHKEMEKQQKEMEKLHEVNERLQEEKKIQEDSKKVHEGYEKLQEVNEKLEKEIEKLHKEKERLHDMLRQVQVTTSQSQQHFMSLSTQMQPPARLLTSEEKTQTSSRRKVKKGSSKDPKTVNTDKNFFEEESEDSQDEQHKVLEAQGQNISLLKLFGQTLGSDLQEAQESTGRKRVSARASIVTQDAREVRMRTFRHLMKQRGEKKEGKFSEWCSKASERAARWFSSSRKRARQRWEKAHCLGAEAADRDPSLPAFSCEEPRSPKAGPVKRRCSPD